MKKSTNNTLPRLKLPNSRLHDRRDPRSYLGDPEDPTDADWELFSALITSRTPAGPDQIESQNQLTPNQSKP